jgi:hypothetical protein
MSITSFPSLFLALSLAACASTPATQTTPAPTPPPTIPADWTSLAGPHATLEAACADCKLSPIHPLTGDFLGVAQASRGMDSFIALQTARGWYIEQREPMQPMQSHHEPSSLYYEIEKTRVASGAVVRMVHSQQVFYPGQGNAGTSHMSWSDRTCRVFGERIACSKPVSIATRHCKRDSIGGGETNETCTGDNPPS